jgi:hypothetical protein
MLPRYPENRPLRLEDKPLLDGIFARLQPRVSELTFAGLYLFREAHSYRISMVSDSVVVSGAGYDRQGYFLPPLSGDAREATLRLLDEGLLLYGADDRFLEQNLGMEGLVVREDRDNFDYLYRRSDLGDLPGNRYHKKKNRINYFLNRHRCTVDTYSERYLEGCLALLDDWHRVHETAGSSSLLAELDANREALAMASPLGLEGVVAVVDGALKGFALGERLNGETSVCHFQKADPFMDGIYQFVDREFNRLLFTDCMYVNREQDLGEPNLRDSKLSYHPVELVKKYRVEKKLSG